MGCSFTIEGVSHTERTPVERQHSYLRREKTEQRRAWARVNRRKAEQAARNGDYETASNKWSRTSGWTSW